MRVRELLISFKPYQWEISSEELSRLYGIPVDRIVRMDLNTLPYMPLKWMRALERRLESLPINLYPSPDYTELREAIADYAGVEAERVVVTAGADEALDMVAKLLIDPGSEAVVSAPTYSFFRVPVELMGGRVVEVPRLRPGFEDDLEGLIGAVGEKTRLIFLCSPNNPTGNPLEAGTLEALLEADAAVVVDETYYEFWGKGFAQLTREHENLIIVRSLSKGFGLAGARVGYIIASEHTAALFNKVRPPNSVGMISVELAKIALRDRRTVEELVARVIKEREKLREELSRIPGVEVYPSAANFLLVRILEKDVRKVHEKLLRMGYVVRDVSSTPGLERCLRITISTPENNKGFLEAFKEALEKA